MRYFLLILLIWLIFLRPTFLFGDTSYIIVVGHSMEPTFYEGDFVLAKQSGSYSVGDVIAYEQFNATVIHRIIDARAEGFITKGDNNPNPDPWVVKRDEVLGKVLFSIPHFGILISQMKNPIALFFILAIAIASVLPESKRKIKPKPQITKKKILLVCLIGLLIFLAFLSNYLNTLPEKERKEFEILSYSHVGEFDYIAHLKPNILYGKTELYPDEGTIYTTLLRELEVFFNYRVQTKPPATVSGNYSVSVYLENPEKWMKQIDFIPKNEFSSGFGFSYKLNLTSVEDLIDRIEKETGVRQTYKLRIEPTILVSSEKFSDKFNPSLNLTIQGKELVVEGLEHRENKSIKGMEFEDKSLGFGVLSLKVANLKLIVLACSAINIVAISAIAVFMREPELSEDELIRRKYGHVVVNVKKLPPTKEVVRLASIEDLMRIAQNLDRFIVHAEIESDGLKHVYCVVDDSTRYEYESKTGQQGGE